MCLKVKCDYMSSIVGAFAVYVMKHLLSVAAATRLHLFRKKQGVYRVITEVKMEIQIESTPAARNTLFSDIFM